MMIPFKDQFESNFLRHLLTESSSSVCHRKASVFVKAPLDWGPGLESFGRAHHASHRGDLAHAACSQPVDRGRLPRLGMTVEVLERVQATTIQIIRPIRREASHPGTRRPKPPPDCGGRPFFGGSNEGIEEVSEFTGRSGRIRTCDPCVPNAVLYRAEPHSDKKAAYSLGFRPPQEAELRTSTPVNLALKTPILPAGEAAVTAAARCLTDGGLVAFPTETVYGLGADATNADAIARLYQAKGRPSFNPLIAHVRDIEAATRIARFDDTAIRLAKA